MYDPVDRYCIEVGVVPLDELRDDVICPVCKRNSELLRLDPDFADEMAGYRRYDDRTTP